MMSGQEIQAGGAWHEIVCDTLKRNAIQLVTYVPDNVFKPLIKAAQGDSYFKALATTREEEAVGVVSGAWMAGLRGIVLMPVGCLATIAMLALNNLVIVVMDSRSHQFTNSRPTATAFGTDLVTMAHGAGLAQSAWAADQKMFARALTQDGPWLIAVRIDDKPGVSATERDPVLITGRVMRGVGAKG